MSYFSISKCVEDDGFVRRVRACAADEGHDAATIPMQLFWHVAIADDISAAYESALANAHPEPGTDPAVISDQMILGNVQAFDGWPTP